MNAFSPGLYLADRSYILPNARDRQYIASLRRIAKNEKADVILPGSQPEAMAIAKQREVFLKDGIFPIVNPYHLLQQCFDKYALGNLLARHGIYIPSTIRITSLKNISLFRFPIVIKPSKDSTGSKQVHIVKNHGEFKMLYNALNMKTVEFLAQEYIGSELEEYTVGTVFGWDGRVIDSIVMKRHLVGFSRGEERVINGKRYVLSTGISQGFFVKQPDVQEYCEYIGRKIGIRGPLNIQCRRTKKGVCVFEVHPRFSGSASLRAIVGFNEPHVLIQEALELKHYEKIPHELDMTVIRKFANVAVKTKKYNLMLQKK